MAEDRRLRVTLRAETTQAVNALRTAWRATRSAQWQALTAEEGTVAWHVRNRAAQDANMFVPDRASGEWLTHALARYEYWAAQNMSLEEWQDDLDFSRTQCGWCYKKPVENTGMCAECLVEVRKAIAERACDICEKTPCDCDWHKANKLRDLDLEGS